MYEIVSRLFIVMLALFVYRFVDECSSRLGVVACLHVFHHCLSFKGLGKSSESQGMQAHMYLTVTADCIIHGRLYNSWN